MKRIIRRGTFETNSSSTHSLTFMSSEEYMKWKKSELYLDDWNDRFYTKDEFDNMVKECAKENDISIDEVLKKPSYYDLPKTYNQFFDEDYLEIEEYEYTTTSGEKIKAVCKYGYDG